MARKPRGKLKGGKAAVANVAAFLKASKDKEELDTYVMKPGAAQACKPAFTGGKQKADVDLGRYANSMSRGSYNRPMPSAPAHLDLDNHKRVMMEGNTKLADVNLESVATLYAGAEVQKIVHTPKQAELRRPFKAVGVFGSNKGSLDLNSFLESSGNSEKEIKEQACWAQPFKVAKSVGKKYQSILNSKKLSIAEKSAALREIVDRNTVSDKKGAKVRTSPAAGQKVFEGLMAQEGVSLERERPILHIAMKYNRG